MLRILMVLLLCVSVGVALSLAAPVWPLRPGLMGFAMLLASAWAVRRYWEGLQPEGRPGSPERALWHGLATYGLLFGHLSATVWQLGPVLAMHSLAGHALAIDSWTLVFGALVSYWIARDPEPRRDERDVLIRNHGLLAGHIALIGLLLALILALGFAGRTVVGQFNQPMLAHVLILIVLAQCLIQNLAQLRLYWLDARAEQGGQ